MNQEHDISVNDINPSEQILSNGPDRKPSVMNLPSLLEDFERNEIRVYGYNCIVRANQFIENMKNIKSRKEEKNLELER